MNYFNTLRYLLCAFLFTRAASISSSLFSNSHITAEKVWIIEDDIIKRNNKLDIGNILQSKFSKFLKRTVEIVFFYSTIEVDPISRLLSGAQFWRKCFPENIFRDLLFSGFCSPENQTYPVWVNKIQPILQFCMYFFYDLKSCYNFQ